MLLTPHERRVAWLKQLCEDCGVCYNDVMGRSRFKRISNVRAVAYAKFIDDGMSLSAVGRFFGRDHTTVMKVARKIASNAS
jgi:chromosomal replication initiation ATPase DnaA